MPAVEVHHTLPDPRTMKHLGVMKHIVDLLADAANAFALTVRYGGEYVAMLCGHHNEHTHTTVVDYLFVAPHARKNGYGRALMVSFETYAQRYDSELELMCVASNGTARNLYASLGYVEIAAHGIGLGASLTLRKTNCGNSNFSVQGRLGPVVRSMEASRV